MIIENIQPAFDTSCYSKDINSPETNKNLLCIKCDNIKLMCIFK